MKIAVIGGGGIQAYGILRDLIESDGIQKVLVVDNRPGLARRRAEALGDARLIPVETDITDHRAAVELLGQVDAVINSSTMDLCLPVMLAALEAGVNYVDLGAWNHTTEQQLTYHQEFKKRGITAVLGMGSAPGISNLMASLGVGMLDTVEDIRIIIAMRDLTQRSSPIAYPYAIDTILDEFTEPASVFRDGRMVEVPPLTCNEQFRFEDPIGVVCPPYVIHPEPFTLACSYKSRGLRNASFQIALPQDFMAKVKFLCELGFGSKEPICVGEQQVIPRQVLMGLLTALPAEEVDVNQYSVTRVLVRGQKDGVITEYNLEMYVGSSKRWNYPAGALKTAVPPSIVGQMLAKGQITEKGVLPPELCVPPKAFFRELAKRGLEVYYTKRAFV
ncbi:MAG: saccharopine dehydrogenase family protein [Bacillota bacterium]